MLPIVQIIVGILVVGVLVWALDSLPGIDATFKQVAKVIIIAVLVIWAILVLYALFVGAAPPLRWWPIR